MNNKLAALFQSLARRRELVPRDLAGSLRDLPEPGSLPSPWETWTLFGLTRHRSRNYWVAEIVRERLHGHLSEIATRGAFGHPETPQRGPVPGLPEWEYYFHGRGCRLTHKVDGEAIDVDFFDDSPEYFDTWFYQRYLESLRLPDAPEQRVRELHPSVDALRIAVADLLAAGALIPFPGRDSHPFRIADGVIGFADDIEAFCQAWPDADSRIWHAALIGDWLAADAAAAGRPEIEEITGPGANLSRGMRKRRLLGALGGQKNASEALEALADLPATDLDRHLKTALEGPPNGVISAALEVIGRENDPRWCEPLYTLFRRVNPEGELPEPHLWMTSLRLMIHHGYRRSELIPALAEVGGTQIGEGLLLSLEHAPELALLLIRKALLHDVPINRTEVAAILGLINAPWSRRELLRALAASNDHEKTADARAALIACGDEAGRRAVLEWEARNPRVEEVASYVEIDGRTFGPNFTIAELSLAGRDSRIRFEMDTLRERVMRLKDVVPPEPPERQPWYRFWQR